MAHHLDQKLSQCSNYCWIFASTTRGSRMTRPQVNWCCAGVYIRTPAPPSIHNKIKFLSRTRLLNHHGFCSPPRRLFRDGLSVHQNNLSGRIPRCRPHFQSPFSRRKDSSNHWSKPRYRPSGKTCPFLMLAVLFPLRYFRTISFVSSKFDADGLRDLLQPLPKPTRRQSFS